MPFFELTLSYESDNDRLYKTINAAQVAIWRTHREVADEAAKRPAISKVDLRETLFPGLQRRGVSVDIAESFLERTVDENWAALAELAIVAVVARYEWWVEQTVQLFAATERSFPFVPGRQTKRSPEKALQFPHSRTSSLKGGTVAWYPGVDDAVQHLLRGHDPLLRKSLTEPLHRLYGTSASQLASLLTVYRYFKEIRNALAHSRAVANQTVVTQAKAAAKISPSLLGLSKPPPIDQYAKGDPVKLEMRTVALFDALVTRLVRTLDAELSCSTAGRACAVARAKAYCSNKGDLPRDPQRRGRRVALAMENTASARLGRAGIKPNSDEVAAFEQLLIAERIVR